MALSPTHLVATLRPHQWQLVAAEGIEVAHSHIALKNRYIGSRGRSGACTLPQKAQRSLSPRTLCPGNSEKDPKCAPEKESCSLTARGCHCGTKFQNLRQSSVSVGREASRCPCRRLEVGWQAETLGRAMKWAQTSRGSLDTRKAFTQGHTGNSGKQPMSSSVTGDTDQGRKYRRQKSLSFRDWDPHNLNSKVQTQ